LLASATYNLELLQACSLHAGVVQKHNLAKEDKGIELLEPLAVLSEAAYREFIEKEGFISFYRQATPIDALEQTQMGSRPARRTGTASLDDLRAIPWVFSWTQARFYLPGWYGVGSALEKMQREDSKAYAALLEGSRDSIFARYVLTNVESSLASSSLELMHAYAGLVDDEKLRDDFMTLIENEHKLTQKHLEAIFERPLLDRRPRFAKALALRAEPLHKLHCEQIKLLKKWRDQGGELPDELLYTINATSSGLRTTG